MNYNNLAQKTNFIAGSDKFEKLPFYLANVAIPGLNFAHPEIGGRTGAKALLQSDNVTFNGLSFEMLIDEDFNIYHEFMDEVRKSINVETGEYAGRDFNFWIQINNNKGNKLFKLEFINCRIESIGDIQLDSQDDSTEHTLSVEIKYDYYLVDKGATAPTPL